MVIDSNELLGESLGTCTLQRLIGRGGMGAVYLAQQLRPRRTVAVKVLMPSVVLETKARAEFLTRFQREADAVAALDHINILQIYEYGEQGDISYLVMPYVTGGTLRELLEKRGSLSLTEIIPILEQAAAALDCAHAHGIVHRDLKPGNILFHADGRILLADFGLAKIFKDITNEERASSPGRTLTSAGAIIGTPEYLSPEQGTGAPIDYHTDIYSLGVMLFQMIIGKVPFSGASPVATAIKHAMEEPPSITQLNPNIPSNVEAVVKKAMAKQPQQRFESAGELAQAFKDAVTGTVTLPSVHSVHVHKATFETIATEDTAPMTPVPLLHEAYIEDARHVTTEEPAKQAAKTPVEAKPTLVDVSRTPVILKQAETIKQLPRRQNRPSNRWRSIRMLLLGCLLTLIIVVGGLLSYAYTQSGKPLLGQTHNGTTPSTTTSTSATQIAQFTPFAYELASAQPVGKTLYQTNIPGSCDKQGETWKLEGNALATCNADNLELKNPGTRHLAGVFLNTLPKGQTFPANYVIQVEVTMKQKLPGEFGIFFRNQLDNYGAYSFMLDAAGLWKVYAYSASGLESSFVNKQIDIAFNTPIILDIVVQNGDFSFYVNSTRAGGAQSGTYSSGTVGLAVDTFTDVSFKNFAHYALP